MMVPDKKEFTAKFLKPRLKKLDTTDETRANSFEALNALCVELHKEDPAWGLLEKTGGARVRNRASDVLLYALPGGAEAQVIDVIGDAEGADGTPKPSWRLADIRPIKQWRLPFSTTPAEPMPETPFLDVSKQLEALEARITLLERTTVKHGQEVELEAPTSRTWAHNHKVKVKVTL